MDNPSAVRIIGPLTTHVEGFCAYLAERGYPPASASLHLRLMAQLSRWLDAEGLEAKDLSPARVEGFLAGRRTAGYKYLLSQRAPMQLIGYLCGVGVISPTMRVPTSSELLVAEYRRHLVVERGLAPSTVSTYTTVAEDVLGRWGNPNTAGLAGVSAADVRSLTLERCRRSSLPSAKAFITAFRSWLRFLNAEGLTSHDLAGAVPAVAGWRGGWIPRGLNEPEMAAVLGSVDLTTPSGLRDRAVMVLLARLALRAGEVAKLALDDIDWHRGEIVIHGKGSRRDVLPLPVDVGEALAAYLRQGRPPASCRALFLRAHAPFVALTSEGVGAIVARAGQRGGIRACAHRLRHSAATAILRGGGSLAEVGQILRHADAATSAIYAKVDYRSLATLAQPWPGSAA